MRKIICQTLSIAVLLFGLFSMALAAAPAAPKLLSPKAGVTEGSVTPTFKWSDVKAAWYHLYLVPTMGGGTITRSGLTKTSYTFTSKEALSYDTSYAWSVRACNPGKPIAECTDIDSAGWLYWTKKDPATVAPKPGDGSESPGGSDCPEGQICNPLSYDSFEDLISAVIKFIYNLGLVVAPIMFVIAGIMFITSAGDPGKAKTARQVALYTAIGFAVILAASGLIKVLQSLLGTK